MDIDAMNKIPAGHRRQIFVCADFMGDHTKLSWGMVGSKPIQFPDRMKTAFCTLLNVPSQAD